MRFVVKRTIILLGLFCISAISTSPAHAYLCWHDYSTNKIMASADYVFTGTAAGAEYMEASADELNTPRKKISFLVKKAWKGVDDTQPLVETDTEALYEYDFKIGEDYLVYGYKLYEDRISIVGCPRVELVGQVARTIESLGEPSFIYREIEKPAPEDIIELPNGAGNIEFDAILDIDEGHEPDLPEDVEIEALSTGITEDVIAELEELMSLEMPDKAPVTIQKQNDFEIVEQDVKALIQSDAQTITAPLLIPPVPTALPVPMLTGLPVPAPIQELPKLEETLPNEQSDFEIEEIDGIEGVEF